MTWPHVAHGLLVFLGGVLQCCGLLAAARLPVGSVRLVFFAGVFLVFLLAALDRDLVLFCAQLFLLVLCWRSVARNCT